MSWLKSQVFYHHWFQGSFLQEKTQIYLMGKTMGKTRENHMFLVDVHDKTHPVTSTTADSFQGKN
jgi:hypothetical protein